MGWIVACLWASSPSVFLLPDCNDKDDIPGYTGVYDELSTTLDDDRNPTNTDS